MRSLLVLLLTVLLVLPAVPLHSLQPCSEMSGAGSHACCHRELPACSLGQPQISCCPVASPAVAQPKAVAPSAELPAPLHSASPFGIYSFSSSSALSANHLLPLTASPLALYQLHRSYRI